MILDGKKVAGEIKGRVKESARQLYEVTGLKPTLAVILVGDDPASSIYVRNKERDCAECGIDSLVVRLPESASEQQVLAEIYKLNVDDTINGIMVQLPLPSHINVKRVMRNIAQHKDVDCFHPVNVGKLAGGGGRYAPCTPAGIIELLKHYDIDIAGKHCVIVGRSNIVGKPLALMMLQHNATVTVCHSYTENLRDICRTADILVSAVGKRDIITADMVKRGATVIDVGISRDEAGALCGDVDYNKVLRVAKHITPVPGGIGPMTRAMLMKNMIYAFTYNWRVE